MRSVTRRATAAAVAVTMTGSLVVAAPAMAGDVSGTPAEVVLADSGAEANDVIVNWGNSPGVTSVNITDYAGFGSITGTCAPDPTWSDQIDCDGRPRVTLKLGAGDDSARSINLMASGSTTIMYGGPGNDTLRSGAGRDLLDGGPGNDVLMPDGDTPAAGDLVSGGPGVDLLDLRPVVASVLHASLDDVANDGRPGDRDNYRSDIENIHGSHLANNTLIGNDGPNTLDGGDRDDVLVGGGGKDRLNGGGGNDTINALDGRGGDRVSCGSGADVVYADPGDVLASDCEKRLYAGKVTALRHTKNGKRVRAKVKCPKGSSGRCKGTIRLVRGGKTLLSRKYNVKRGTTKKISLKTTARGRKVLRKKKRVKARLLVSSRKVAAPAGKQVKVHRR